MQTPVSSEKTQEGFLTEKPYLLLPINGDATLIYLNIPTLEEYSRPLSYFYINRETGVKESMVGHRMKYYLNHENPTYPEVVDIVIDSKFLTFNRKEYIITPEFVKLVDRRILAFFVYKGSTKPISHVEQKDIGDVPEPDYKNQTTVPHYNMVYKGHKIDPYRIMKIYGITDAAQQHAIKKLLRAGKSHKSFRRDIEEVIISLNRLLEMIEEDGRDNEQKVS